MTIEKSKTINIPVWLVSIIMPLIVTLITTWGILSGTVAELKLQARTNKDNIETLHSEKIDRNEFNQVTKQLEDIKAGVKDLGRKLDDHMNKK
jgi:hypothetical protein